jgi:hypothetical protein
MQRMVIMAATASVPQTPPPTTPSSANPTTAAALVSVNPAYTSTTTVTSLADLKKKAPQVYNAMLLGIAQTICDQMQQDQNTLTQLTQEGEEDPND